MRHPGSVHDVNASVASFAAKKFVELISFCHPTVWKFQKCPATQTFPREINSRDLKCPKIAISTHLEALNFHLL